MRLRPVEQQNDAHIHEIQHMARQYKSLDQYNRDTRIIWIAIAIGMGIITILIALIILTVIA